MKKVLFTLALLLAFGQGAWAQTTATTDTGLFDAVKADGTVVLGSDIDINSVLIIEHTTTLDLKGRNLTRKGAEGDKNNGWVVWVKSTGNLTIKDTGTGGTITGGYAYNGAGIYNEGTLTIEGGTISGNTVVDKSGVDGRGGGIFNASGATLTITGGTITGNEAVGSAHGGAGIFNDGTLTITGGTVTGNTAAHGGGIKNYGTLSMKGATVVKDNTGSDVWLGNGTVINVTGALTGGAKSIGIEMERVGTFTNGYGTSSTATSPFFASKAVNDIVSTGGENKLRIGYYECSWDAENKQVVHTLKHIEGDVIYMTGGKNANLGENMTDSWYIVEGTINYSDRVWCYNNVHLILSDNAKMTIGKGLKVFSGSPQNASLKIYSQSYGDNMGKLECNGAISEAGIGGVASTKMGSVEFHGGDIYAYGGRHAAGIGGGEDANSGPITIFDGKIEAINNDYAAAIGGGQGGSAEVITIYGGNVQACYKKPDSGFHKQCAHGASIGGGAYNKGGGGSGVITIWGGTVRAEAGDYGAGIGAGLYGILDEVNIHGGHVTALGGARACGIGGGFGCQQGGTINITGGTVQAYAGTNGLASGAGIGSDGKGGYTINISGGDVYAKGADGSMFVDYSTNTSYVGYNGPGLGCCGDIENAGVINITGGTVLAESGAGEDIIGAGIRHTKGTISISGGDVKLKGKDFAILSKESTVTISGRKVSVGADAENIAPVTAAEMAEAFKQNKYAKLEACTDHHYIIDLISATEHSATCLYCGTSVTGGHEIPAGTGYCSFCGYGSGVRDVSFIVPQLNEDGFCKFEGSTPVYQGVATTEIKSKHFYLPVCNDIPKGYVFAGWEVGQTVTSLEAAAGATLLQPGEEYELTGTTAFTAHFTALAIELANGSSNNAVIIQNENKTAHSVTLTGRTLYKDGTWNTLCLPFTIEDFDGTIFADATVMTLGNSGGCATGFDESTGTLTLDFVDANAIEAGVAYIVKWAGGENISNPTFTDVTIENEDPADHAVISSDETVSFVGTYSPVKFEETVKSILFLGADNTLYYPQPDTTDPDNPACPVIGSQHAYFQLNGITAGEPATGVRAFVLRFGESTGMTTTKYTNLTNCGDGWCTLDGRRLSGKPSRRGVYVNNGKKVVVKK